MAKPAYVLLNVDGVVIRTHTPDITGAPSNNPGDLETLIAAGYVAVREVVLEGGKVLIVLQK